MKLFNTLTRKIEEIKPIQPGLVKIYTCGPTVYDHTHLGHMRTYTNTDFIRRALEYLGYEVKQVMNITDVGHLFGDGDQGEDKIEVKAKKEKTNAWEIAKKYEKEFFITMDKLNVKRPTVACRATDHIQEMINLIKRIENNGYAYKTSDGIYFDTSKIESYTKLSGMPIEGLQEGARIESNPEKRNPTDFSLWRFSPKDKQRQMEWNSPWRKGFPGWHIECSAMGMKYLGENFDIHTGGEDHIPIHHTNERAQNIAATGHEVVNTWVHNIFLMIEGQKMSKSLNNFYWIKDITDKGYNLLTVRYLFLTTHYRSQFNFTWRGLKSAQRAFNNLKRLIIKWKQDEDEFVENESMEEYKKEYRKVISNDADAPQALALTWRVVKSDLSPKQKLQLILDFDKVLGLEFSRIEVEKIPSEITVLAKKRQQLRLTNEWGEADRIRKQIERKGWEIKDTQDNFELKRKT